ncbi:MAG TPA: AMP-binding protein [bacterium]
MKTYQIVSGAIRGLAGLMFDEYRRGTLRETIRLTRRKGRLTFAHEFSHSDLLEEKARKNIDRPFLYFYGQTFTYAQMNANANRVANYLYTLGAKPGNALAIMMKNSPRWLDTYFGAQRLGMCAVPVNIALRGDQLAHIFNHSEVKFICIDYDLMPYFDKIRDTLVSQPRVIINLQGAHSGAQLSRGQEPLNRAYESGISMNKPDIAPREGDPCLLMYTSGTTGLPKGVATRYGSTGIMTIGIISRALFKSDDVYFTCLPLFHANALLITLTSALHANARMALCERFSASHFWEDIRTSGATVFNTLGAMIPILMKQPEKPADREHNVSRILSAACPAEMWAPFEKRFGVKIIEAYGAVDGGGFLTLNYGQAPAGSIGKPFGAKHRIVDDNMNDVPVGKHGELIFYTGKNKGKTVEYYKDEKATSNKVKDGWLHTGDLTYIDKKGYLYFIGRKTESLRRRGENISAYEVEHAILQHPDVLECAVYAVPSELGEDDVMAAIVLLEGKTINPKNLVSFLKDRLARFAIPRYLRILSELPKTETQRVIKSNLQKEGITKDTLDMEPGGRKIDLNL